MLLVETEDNDELRVQLSSNISAGDAVGRLLLLTAIYLFRAGDCGVTGLR